MDEKQVSVFENLTKENACDFFKSCSGDENSPLAFPIRLTSVLTDEDEVYNESFLANLRLIVGCADSTSLKIAFFPICDGEFANDAKIVTAAMKHTARRLKKATSVVGFYYPEADCFKDEKARQFFADELLEKHPQYKFYFIESAR